MKGSQNDLSFHRMNQSSHRQTPNRYQPSPLEVSRASKHSYNSDYQMRPTDAQNRLTSSRRFPHQKDSNSYLPSRTELLPRAS